MSDHLQILGQFPDLKQIGQGKWVASCLAHPDKSPSLHFKDAGDKLLVRCFAGCSFRDIADSIGARPSQFFAGGYDRREFDKVHRVPWRDIVVVMRGEFWAVMRIASILRAGRPLTDADFNRLVEAGRRIEQAWRVGNG